MAGYIGIYTSVSLTLLRMLTMPTNYETLINLVRCFMVIYLTTVSCFDCESCLLSTIKKSYMVNDDGDIMPVFSFFVSSKNMFRSYLFNVYEIGFYRKTTHNVSVWDIGWET